MVDKNVSFRLRRGAACGVKMFEKTNSREEVAFVENNISNTFWFDRQCVFGSALARLTGRKKKRKVTS